jgi:hypothetical protein
VAGELASLSVVARRLLGISCCIWFPFGLPDTVTKDFSSAVPGDYVQTDAQINHGNSGGPLLNVRGSGQCLSTSNTDSFQA